MPSDQAERIGDTTTEPPAWGEDAAQIAEEAGLGGYAGTPEETEVRITIIEGRLAEISMEHNELVARQRFQWGVIVALLAASCVSWVL